MINKEMWIDIIKSFLSTLLMGIGITIFINCELGSDPISVFLDGFHRVSGMEISLIDQVLICIILIIGFIVNRKAIGINTIINALVLGVCIQIPNTIIEPMNLSEQAIWIRIIAIVLAQLLLAGSFAWLQTFKNGISSLDVIIFYIIEKTGLKYRTIRIVYDGIFIITGWLLGGVVGVGTIFSLSTNGYFTEQIKIKIDSIINNKTESRIKDERKYS